jgi:uncharacterized protein (DUF58 family)
VLAGAVLGTWEVVVLGTTIAALLGTSAVWVARAARAPVLTRAPRPRPPVAGGELEVHLELRGPRPPAAALVETVRLETPGAPPQRRRTPFPLPAAGREARLAYRVPVPQRGRLRLGPARLRVTDPFGLVQRVLRLGTADELLVWPRPTRVEPRRWRGTVSAAVPAAPAARSPVLGGDELLGLRAYEPGDDLRRIHWRTSARLDLLVVRQEDPRRPPPVTIVLEADLDPARFERSVSRTAGLAIALARADRPFRVLTGTGRLLGGPGAARGGARGLAATLDALATVAVEAPAPTRLAAALRRAEGAVVLVGPDGLRPVGPDRPDRRPPAPRDGPVPAPGATG